MAKFGHNESFEIIDTDLREDEPLQIFLNDCLCGLEQSAWINRSGSIAMIKRLMRVYNIDQEELYDPPPCDACGKPVPDGDNVGIECNLHRGCAVEDGGNHG